MAETPLDPQPKDTQELLRTIHSLTDERRIEARERARAMVIKSAGEMPMPKDFEAHTESKYPSWMNWTINGLCLIVLIAAFLPSAIRLFFIGSKTFVETLPDAQAAMVAGYSIVIMAEISMVLFSIASVVMQSHKAAPQPDARGKLSWTARIDSVKALLTFSQLVATTIAVIGNAQVSLPHHQDNPFALIEAFTPSIVVFTTAYILKAQMLTSIERRHANTRAYQMALNAWKISTTQTDKDPAYRPALHNALRDFIREDNVKGTGATARREYMAGLILADWRVLVKRELMADEWYTDPDAQTVSVVPVQSRPVHSVRSFAVNERVNGNGSMNGEFIQPVHSQNGVNEYEAVNGEFVHSDRSVNSANGYTKRMDAKSVARLFLDQHPEHMATRLDDLVPLIEAETGVKVGRTSIHNARKDMGG